MPKRAKVLVVDSDLHALSKIYLALVHRDYKVEAADNAEEIIPRIDRFKPRLIILHARAKNLTTEIFMELNRRRLHIFFVDGEGWNDAEDSRRLVRIQSPSDMQKLDNLIRETLDIYE